MKQNVGTTGLQISRDFHADISFTLLHVQISQAAPHRVPNCGGIHHVVNVHSNKRFRSAEVPRYFDVNR